MVEELLKDFTGDVENIEGMSFSATYGCSWFSSLKDCADKFLSEDKQFNPIPPNVGKYKEVISYLSTSIRSNDRFK